MLSLVLLINLRSEQERVSVERHGQGHCWKKAGRRRVKTDANCAYIAK